MATATKLSQEAPAIGATAHTINDGAAFPNSRFAPVPLLRPLEVFGRSFAVEVSSSLTLGPDTVLRATIGKSIQSLLRDGDKLQPLKQLRYALLGRHRISRTTRGTILQAFGPLSHWVASRLDGQQEDARAHRLSDWQCLAVGWRPVSPDHVIDIIIRAFLKLDELGEAAAALMATGQRAQAESLLRSRLDPMQATWLEICPTISLEGCLRIETALRVLAEADASGRAPGDETTGERSVVEDLLDDGAKPMANWLALVLDATHCKDYRDLSDLLDRRQVRQKSGRAISHDTLKGWSSMKPGMLMSLDGCTALLSCLADPRAAGRLQIRFALARFLAFLCDLLRSSARSEAPTWRDAQRMIAIRYRQILESRTDWLSASPAEVESMLLDLWATAAPAGVAARL